MKNKKVVIITLTTILLSFLVIAFLSFNHNFTVYIEDHIVSHLEELLAPNVKSFELQINEQVKKVNTIADVFSKNEEMASEENLALLKSVVDNNHLENCMIVYPDGTAVNQNGVQYTNMQSEEFFKATMNGEFYISNPLQSLVDPNKKVITFAAPIIKDNKVEGALLYSYWSDTIDTIFNLSFLNGQGRIVIVNQKGDLLIGDLSSVPNGEHVLEYFNTLYVGEGISPKEHTTQLDQGGVFTVENIDHVESSLIVDYVKLSTRDWYMLSIAPESAVMEAFAGVFEEQNKMIVILVGCLIVYGMVLLGVALSDKKNRDKMTGALTRNTFIRGARKILRRNPSVSYVFIKLDVRNFKIINRVHDFETGNRVIINIAKAMDYIVKENNGIFCRLGVDDFVLLLPFDTKELLAVKRMKFIKKFRELMGKDFTTIVEFPTGQYVVTPYDAGRNNVFEIMEKINFAHAKAKVRSGGVATDYYEDLEREALQKSSIENKMNDALKNREFKMYLQPKVCLKTNKVCGAEALVRWQEDDKIISPNEFIPIFEANGFISKVDFYIFEQAAIFLRKMMDEGIEPITISINFSRVHLYNEKFVLQLKGIADKYKVPYKYLEVELTETVVFENISRIMDLIKELHATGFTMSMDDFGSGYSSLSLLKDVEVDVLKIDRAFFVDTMNSDRAKIVISNIIDMAKELQVMVVAEGIETSEQVSMLKELKCDMIQGFYYFKPISVDAFDFDIVRKEY